MWGQNLVSTWSLFGIGQNMAFKRSLIGQNMDFGQKLVRTWETWIDYQHPIIFTFKLWEEDDSRGINMQLSKNYALWEEKERLI